MHVGLQITNSTSHLNITANGTAVRRREESSLSEECSSPGERTFSQVRRVNAFLPPLNSGQGRRAAHQRTSGSLSPLKPASSLISISPETCFVVLNFPVHNFIIG